MYIVKRNTYGGMDWHDCYTTTEYVKPSEEEFGFKSYDEGYKALIDSIVKEYPQHESEIRNAFVTGKEIMFPIPVEITENNISSMREPEIFKDGNVVLYYENEVTIIPSELKIITDYGFGQIRYITYCYITEYINPVYAVIENFLAPTKGVDSIERMYHKPFSTVKEAKEYIKATTFHEEGYDVQIYIAAFDLDKCNKKWLDLQYQIIDLMDSFDKDMLHDVSFTPFIQPHLENLEIAKQMDAIAILMDDEKREQVHCELAPCEPKRFLKRYLELDPDFAAVLSNEFSIQL